MDKTIFTKQHKYIVSQLKKARQEAGLTQVQAAELLKCPQSYISKVEAGQHRIDVVQLQEFARIYKKKLGFFIK
ncbi:MAG: multiprotein-bridging factor 1 family protein [Candidatus Thorarchaeota archaeon]